MDGSEASVVERARAGDQEAFRVLVERHSGNIFRLAYRMTGNEHDAEDVVQEAFLRAYRQLKRFEGRAAFSTWLYRIAVNSALDQMRSRTRHEERREASDPERPDPLARLPAAGPSPERLVFSAQVQERVAAALAQLTPKERAAFVLRHFEGQSIEEIGRALGVRASAAKNNVFRAVQKLRQRLEPVVKSTR